jgi:hypothetical protein
MAAIFYPQLNRVKIIFYKYGHVIYRWLANLMLIQILIGNKGPKDTGKELYSPEAKALNMEISAPPGGPNKNTKNGILGP